jgi:hypothetical protein
MMYENDTGPIHYPDHCLHVAVYYMRLHTKALQIHRNYPGYIGHYELGRKLDHYIWSSM